MAIQNLTDEQIRTWTIEQKDRWWLEKVWKGDMPQLTLRAAVTGFLLGGILSATNLYVGAKTGWSLGVGITSVILAFATFRVLSQIGLVKDLTILENNCSQSIATAAGYMTAPLISSLTAYMIVHGELLPWWQIMTWTVVVSLLGVLFAFPMKRRFINDEQHPFPEGRAAGVVMDTLHSTDAMVGMAKAKSLVWAAGGAAFVKFLQADSIQTWLQYYVFGRESALHQRALAIAQQVKDADVKLKDALAEQKAVLTEQIKQLAAELKGVADQLHEKMLYLPEQITELLGKYFGVKTPKLAGIDTTQLTITPALDLALIGAGGLMGIRAGFSLFLGAVINYFILAPWMIREGQITEAVRNGVVQPGVYGLRQITLWSLWPGVACMVIASFVAFFAKPQIFTSAFRGLFGKKREGSDVLQHIELPLWISIVGVPILSVVAALMAQAYFDVKPWVCLVGLPLTFVLALVAANSTALTGTTPVGATAKITQLFYGRIARGEIHTNIATASITAEVVSNASNLLMDIKPGYMLGAKPRQQAIGHCIGILAGSIASVPLFFLLFTQKIDKTSPETIAKTIDTIQSKDFAMPAVTVWKAVAEVLSQGFEKLAPSLITAIVIASLVGLVLELARILSKGKFPLSPVAMGLAFVIDFQSSCSMFLGALFFWIMGVGRGSEEAPESKGVFVRYHEPICGGVIAGAALMGIADAIARAFFLRY